TPVMGQHQKYVKDLEPDGGHGEEVDRDQLLGMVLQEGAPSLRRRFAAAQHISIYLLTLLSPMSMPSLSSSPWMRGAPQPGFSRHILRIRSRTSLEMTGRPGFPQRTFQVQNKRKPARCQGYDRFWLDDDQRRAPIAPEARQTDPQQAVARGQFWALSCRPVEHADLMA